MSSGTTTTTKPGPNFHRNLHSNPDDEFDEELDVLVVGSGCAGCAAAISACRELRGTNHEQQDQQEQQHKLSVVIAEKSEKMVGGTTKLAGGGWLWVPNNKYLRELGVKQREEDVVELLKSLAGISNEGNGAGNQDSNDNDNDDANDDDDRATDEALMETFAREWPEIVDILIEEEHMHLKLVEVREQEDAAKVFALLKRKLDSEIPNFSQRTGITEDKLERLSHLMPSYCAEHPADHCPSGKVLAPDGSTTSLQLEKAARNLGAEIRMGCQVVDLIFDSNGDGADGASGAAVTTSSSTSTRKEQHGRNHGRRVIGAVLEETETIKSTSEEPGKPKTKVKTKTKRVFLRKGIVFASGGFSHNQELMNEHFGGKELAPVGTCAAKTNTGDFVTLASKYNIPSSGLDTAWLKQTVLPHKFPQRIGVFFLNGDSFFVVDRTGKRFANDRMFYQQRGLQMLKNPERKCVFFIYDARAAKLFDGPIKGLGGPIPMNKKGFYEDCEVRGSNCVELKQGIEQKLREVAPDFTLDTAFHENLDAQLKRFNEMASTDGVDYEFGRGQDAAQYCWSVPRAKDNTYPNKTMHPLDEKNLRCVILGLSTLDTKGGPRINSMAQVLDDQRKPVQGLFGAGNCIRSSTRNSYPASGATMANAVLFGWIAGRQAVANQNAQKPGSVVRPGVSRL